MRWSTEVHTGESLGLESIVLATPDFSVTTPLKHLATPSEFSSIRYMCRNND
jgi:hypothetical protein